MEKRIESSSIADKEEWLAIIRDSEPADLDRKEWKLKQLPSYREVLNTIYPALRHSDYTVEYHIRNFTTDEAQTYEVGSESYNEVFEIAVRLYPDDPISNLNAANTALLNRNATAARRYLTKAAEGPEKRLAEGVASWLEGDTDQARSIFESLTNDPKVGVQAKENLEKMD